MWPNNWPTNGLTAGVGARDPYASKSNWFKNVICLSNTTQGIAHTREKFRIWSFAKFHFIFCPSGNVLTQVKSSAWSWSEKRQQYYYHQYQVATYCPGILLGRFRYNLNTWWIIQSRQVSQIWTIETLPWWRKWRQCWTSGCQRALMGFGLNQYKLCSYNFAPMQNICYTCDFDAIMTTTIIPMIIAKMIIWRCGWTLCPTWWRISNWETSQSAGRLTIPWIGGRLHHLSFSELNSVRDLC